MDAECARAQAVAFGAVAPRIGEARGEDERVLVLRIEVERATDGTGREDRVARIGVRARLGEVRVGVGNPGYRRRRPH